MVEITIEGLNARQKVLADIIWSYDDFADVQKFIKSLPKTQQAEAESIVELMKMSAIEQLYNGINDNPDAKRVIDKIQKL
jgi:hypothetical protein